MSIDHYRNISFSAYIEFDFLDCTGKFAENVFRICSPFHVGFSLPMWPLLSKPLYISMRRRKMYLFSTQSNKKSVNLGTLPVFFLSPNTLWKFYLSICLETWKNLYGKKYGQVKNLYGTCEGFLEKNEKHIWKNAEIDWKSERIYMTKIWKIEEFVWKHEGFIKKVKNFHGKMTNSPGQAKEFIWSNGILIIGFLTSTVF